MEFACVLIIAIVYVQVSGAAELHRAKRQWFRDEDYCRTRDGDSGICINIKDCKTIYKFIQQNTVTDPIKQAITNYICDQNSQRVCCPPKVPDSLASLGMGTVDHSTHRNYKLLPSVCGQGSTTDKIINGKNTSLYEFPWAVILKYDRTDYPWSCGASLINDRYVLTAAHCIRSQYKLTTVRLGEHDFNSDPDCEIYGRVKQCADSPQDFQVTEKDFIVHPEYDTFSYENDIALIRLPKPLVKVGSISSICIPITVPEKTFDFRNYTVIGWGATKRRYSSAILQKVMVPKVQNSVCAPNYPPPKRLTDKNLCAGGHNEKDSCPGDSGGPLSAEYTVGGIYKTIQYGIVSLGPNLCGAEGFPTLYTRVEKYVGWILDNMKP